MKYTINTMVRNYICYKMVVSWKRVVAVKRERN